MTILILMIVLFPYTEFALASLAKPCGEVINNVKESQIKLISTDLKHKCNWIIAPLPETITTLRILDLNLENCSKDNICCISITDHDTVFFNLCNDKLQQPALIVSRKNNIFITIEAIDIPLNVWFNFTSRNKSECLADDFQCLDKSGCYNYSQLCNENFTCSDHSDYTGCGVCNATTTLCHNSTDQCFDPITQRCNGILDCSTGEDELNCTALCPQLIKCPTENKCITLNQICDLAFDCVDGFDEKYCFNDSSSLRKTVITIMFILCSICCTLFVCLIFRWIFTRRDINRFLRNLPEFPLEPFAGPGDPSAEETRNDDLDAEFTQGGQIYEHYMIAIRRKEKVSKSVQADIGITPKYSHLELDGDNEMVVLASLNVPTDMCVGLSISESSKESLRTLKSISDFPSTPSETCFRRASAQPCCEINCAHRNPSGSLPGTSLAKGDANQTIPETFQTRRRRRSRSTTSYSETSNDSNVPTTTVIIEHNDNNYDISKKSISAPFQTRGWIKPPRPNYYSSTELTDIRIDPTVPRDSTQWIDIEDNSQREIRHSRKSNRRGNAINTQSGQRRKKTYSCTNKPKKNNNNNWV